MTPASGSSGARGVLGRAALALARHLAPVVARDIPLVVALSTARSLALSTARSLALSTARSLALSTARFLALPTARSLAPTALIVVLLGGGPLAQTAAAAGFMLNEHGARATGRAGAVAATIDDGSAIYHNPAGIALAPGYNLYVGGSVIAPSVRFTDTDGHVFEAERHETLTPHVYATGRILDWLAVGVGFNTPFGNRITWPEGTPGTELAREQILRTYFISPVVAFNLDAWVPGLSVGGGVDLVPATVEQERDVLFGTTTGRARLAGDAFGVGGRVGAMYHPSWLPGLRFGLTWRSEVQLDFTGLVDFDAPAPFRTQLPPDGTARTSLALPQSLLFGTAFRLGPAELEVDLNYVNWGVYQEQRVDLPHGAQSVSRRAWRDTLAVRVGAEFNLYEMNLDVRGGYAWDPTPVPGKTLDLTLPDVNRHVVTVGGSYYLPYNFYIDGAILYVVPNRKKTKDQPLTPLHKGSFEVSAVVATLSLGWRWGEGAQQPKPVYALPIRFNLAGGP